MAEWYVRLLDQFTRNPVGEYTLQEPTVEVLNSDVGGFGGEIALSQTRRFSTAGITRDQFAPYRTHYEIYRQSSGNGVLISDGMLTSVNLNFNRDTLLLAGKDWKHYLQRRVYPFSPEGYLTYDSALDLEWWPNWPKKWFDPDNLEDLDEIGEVPLGRVVRDILASMRARRAFDWRVDNGIIAGADRADGVPAITWNINITDDPLVKYRIYPGDQTTIFEHIQALSELTSKGFEWDIIPGSLEFKMWVPRKYPFDTPVYTFRSTGIEGDGMITEFDWTNEGPEGTHLLGMGTIEYKVGAEWEYHPSIIQFGLYDMVYDFGKQSNYDMLLDRLKDQNDLHPQKKLSLAILNPEFLAPTQYNFYTGGRPRSLIGNTVRVVHNFAPYHTVDAYFRINAIKWAIDASTNETVTLELEMVYEPDGRGSDG